MPLQNESNVTLALIVLHAIFLGFAILAVQPLKFGAIVFGAYLFRIAAMIVDRFTSLELPFLGSPDADGFFLAASMISEDLSLAGDTYGGAYTAILGYIFHYVGPDRLLGQYLNVMFSVSTVVILAGILRQLRINSRVRETIIGIAAFMPLIVAHTSILLRESIIQVLVAASVYFFIKGLITSKTRWTAVAILLALCASAFHSGVVGIVIGFVLISVFTSKKEGHFVFGLRGLAPALLAIFTLAITLMSNPELFLDEFQTLDSSEDLLSHGLSGQGGAAYLENLEVNSWWTFVLFAPLRMLYFVVSPMPWDWRGINDILAFGLDSMVYVAVILLFIVHKIEDHNKRYIAMSLAFILAITCLIFGIGVSNSGTAIRHRGKLIGIVLALLALLLDSRRLKADKRHRKKSLR